LYKELSHDYLNAKSVAAIKEYYLSFMERISGKILRIEQEYSRKKIIRQYDWDEIICEIENLLIKVLRS